MLIYLYCVLLEVEIIVKEPSVLVYRFSVKAYCNILIVIVRFVDYRFEGMCGTVVFSVEVL